NGCGSGGWTMRIALPDNRDRRAWQAAVWDAWGEELSGPQKLEFVRLLELPYDPDDGGLDPFPVVRDLLAHRHRWTATPVVTRYPSTLGRAPPAELAALPRPGGAVRAGGRPLAARHPVLAPRADPARRAVPARGQLEPVRGRGGRLRVVWRAVRCVR